MDTYTRLHAQMTVESVLKLDLKAWAIFRANNTDCIGCFMQRFCSLQEVAEVYHFPVEDLLEELKQCVEPTQIDQGASYENS
jgi:hypothetical protein